MHIEEAGRDLAGQCSISDMVRGLLIYLPCDHQSHVKHLVSFFRDLRGRVPELQRQWRCDHDVEGMIHRTLRFCEMGGLLIPDYEAGPDRITPRESHKPYTRRTLTEAGVLPRHGRAVRTLAKHYMAFVHTQLAARAA